MSLDRIVLICEHCGTGFLRMPPTNGVHSFAVWSVGIMTDGPQGPECWGSILPVPIGIAVMMAEERNAADN